MSIITAISSSRANRQKSIAIIVAEAMATSVDSRLAGKSASTAKSLFVGYNTSMMVTERNASCWCSDVPGITCISPWNNHGGYRYGTFLIAPDILIGPYHVLHSVPTTFYCIDADGNSHGRNSTAQARVGTTDILVIKLASNFPTSIAFAKLLPQSIFDKIAVMVNEGTIKIPALLIDQQENALVGDTLLLNSSASFIAPTNSKRLEFNETIINGDSGNGGFWIYMNDLIPLMEFHYGGGGDGPSIHYHRDEINSVITFLGSSYQLTQISIPE